MIPSETDQQQIRARASAIESQTGIEIVTAIRARSDSYPELPWKAFGFTSALAAALLVLAGLSGCPLAAGLTVIGIMLGIFGPALVAVLLTLLVPPFARLWLDSVRAETEVWQAGQGLFLEHELFRTRDRCGVLVLISLFERRVLVLPDRGVRDRLPAAGWDAVVVAMNASLRAGRPAVDALLAGLDALEHQLLRAGVRGSSRDEIPEALILPGNGERKP